MKSFKTQAHIYSLNGEMDEITVLEETGNNEYLVDYRGVKCSAIFNWYNCTYYADDVYGRKKDWRRSFIITTDMQGLYSDTATETADISNNVMCSIPSAMLCKNSAKSLDCSESISSW